MAVEKLAVEQFVKLSRSYPVMDVRSEGEFLQAHIPGAHSLPLFNNDERKVVGTIYKQQSREQAIKKGLEYFGPKMKDMIVFVEKLMAKNPSDKTVMVHCWRGGMRSAGVAWLLDLYGFKVYTLVGGYKAYRNWVLRQFSKQYSIINLGGFTGSGKTLILHELDKRGEAVIDLEGLAGHRGSALGRIGLPEQCSNEMFENKLASQLYFVSMDHPGKQIWIEDESMRIGSVSIPHAFWPSMRNSKVYFVNIPFNERLNNLVLTYGVLNKSELGDAIKRIEKKLGGLETKNALLHLENNNFYNCFHILLCYYDKLYLKSLHTRDSLETNMSQIECETVDIIKNTDTIIQERNGR